MHKSKEFTVRRPRVGLDGLSLASLSLSEAQAKFSHLDKRLVKEMHTEAVKTKKANEKGSKKKS